MGHCLVECLKLIEEYRECKTDSDRDLVDRIAKNVAYKQSGNPIAFLKFYNKFKVYKNSEYLRLVGIKE